MPRGWVVTVTRSLVQTGTVRQEGELKMQHAATILKYERANHQRESNRELAALLSVSFLGAANDNVLKQILILMVATGGIWANYLGPGTQGIISLVLSVPFILLSGFAGQVADRIGKQQVIRWVKLAEIPIAILALLGLSLGNFWLSVAALALMAVQSTFYGPAKFGILPDLVGPRRLQWANGLTNAITNVAVILGCIVAGPLADLYCTPQHEALPATSQVHVGESLTPKSAEPTSTTSLATSTITNRLPSGLLILVIGMLGWLCSLRLRGGRETRPNTVLTFELFRPHLRLLRQCGPRLRGVLACWSGFYFIAAFALLLLPEFRSLLGTTNTVIGYLTGLLAISIVLGSLAAGWLSAATDSRQLSTVGAIGMMVGFGAMAVTPINLQSLGIFVFVVGLFGGLFVIPLQTDLQTLCPADARGQFFGTANALSFVCISAAGLIFYLVRVIGLPLASLPLICGLLSCCAAVATWRSSTLPCTAPKATKPSGP